MTIRKTKIDPEAVPGVLFTNHPVKHGLLTKALSFRSDEEKADLRELAAALEEDLKPRGILEIAVCWWKGQTTQHLQLKGFALGGKRSNEIAITSPILLPHREANRWRWATYSA